MALAVTVVAEGRTGASTGQAAGNRSRNSVRELAPALLLRHFIMSFRNGQQQLQYLSHHLPHRFDRQGALNEGFHAPRKIPLPTFHLSQSNNKHWSALHSVRHFGPGGRIFVADP